MIYLGFEMLPYRGFEMSTCMRFEMLPYGIWYLKCYLVWDLKWYLEEFEMLPCMGFEMLPCMGFEMVPCMGFEIIYVTLYGIWNWLTRSNSMNILSVTLNVSSSFSSASMNLKLKENRFLFTNEIKSSFTYFRLCQSEKNDVPSVMTIIE